MSTYLEEISELCGADLEKYRDPHEASGWCLVATQKLGRSVDWDGVEMVYTNHENDPSRRFAELQQYSDHYALYVIEDDLVLDYTMRQFDSRAPFPYIGTVEQWKTKLAVAWEYKELNVVHGVPCELCDYLQCICCFDCGGMIGTSGCIC